MKECKKRKTIWISRHGNREDFVNQEWINSAERSYDPDLSQDGINQAKELAKQIANKEISHIFCSPFLRTVHTAYYCSLESGTKTCIENGLCEILLSEWYSHKPDFMTISDLYKKFPVIDLDYESFLSPNFPEDEDIFNKRCSILAKEKLDRVQGDVLVIAHEASCRSIILSLVGIELAEINFCSLIKIEKTDNGWILSKQ